MTLRVGALTLEPERSTDNTELYVHGAVVICVARGRIQINDADVLIALLEGITTQHRPISIYHDWEAVEGYESAARLRLTSWSSKAPGGTLGQVHVLFRSRLVAMGVATAALALRVMGLSVTSHSSRATFDAALVAGVGASRGRAPRG